MPKIEKLYVVTSTVLVLAAHTVLLCHIGFVSTEGLKTCMDATTQDGVTVCMCVCADMYAV